jgi:hypothetical protein
MEEGEEVLVEEEEMEWICLQDAAKKECTILRNALAA